MVFDITDIGLTIFNEMLEGYQAVNSNMKSGRLLVDVTELDSKLGNFFCMNLLCDKQDWDNFTIVRKGYGMKKTCWNIVDQSSHLYCTSRGSFCRHELSYSNKIKFDYGTRYKLLKNPDHQVNSIAMKFKVIFTGDLNLSKKIELSINKFCRSNGIHVGPVDGEGLWDSELYHQLGGWGIDLGIEIYSLSIPMKSVELFKQYVNVYFTHYNTDLYFFAPPE